MSAWTDQLAALVTTGTALEATSIQAAADRDAAKAALATAQAKIVELQAQLDAAVPPAIPQKTVTAEDLGSSVVRLRWQNLDPSELGRVGPPVYFGTGWNTSADSTVLAKAKTDGYLDFTEAAAGVPWTLYATDPSGTYSADITPGDLHIDAGGPGGTL